MNFLFVHNNFPGQFRNLASELASQPSNIVKAIGAETSRGIANVTSHRYRAPATDGSGVHAFARRFDSECRRAEQVLFVAADLAASGFRPDFIFVHCGWGENLPLRSIFPKSKIIVYCEFYYRQEGQDVHFDPEGSWLGADGAVGLHCRNASTVLALVEADIGLSPTVWQRSTYPTEFHRKIKVCHEGIDIQRLQPDDSAEVLTPSGRRLRKGQEIITFVARSLEPLRGYHILMRALPEIMKARPKAEAIILGGDGSSYGPPAPEGTTWKKLYLDENRKGLDVDRVHFLGLAPYDTYLNILRISAVHIYLTYPFVLSWSLLEAMAMGCIIVGSDTEPVREAIDSSSGILTPFLDSSRLAYTVIKVLSNRKSYARLGVQASAVAALRFDKRDRIPHMMQILGL